MDHDTLPPGPADDAALAFGRKLAAETDDLLALPGSARFDHIEKHVRHATKDE